MRPGEIHHEAARTLLEKLSRQHLSLYLPIIALAEVAASISRVTGSTERAYREVALIRQMPSLSLVGECQHIIYTFWDST
jgi:predicted nucleic acid-binding protein